MGAEIKVNTITLTEAINELNELKSRSENIVACSNLVDNSKGLACEKLEACARTLTELGTSISGLIGQTSAALLSAKSGFIAADEAAAGDIGTLA